MRNRSSRSVATGSTSSSSPRRRRVVGGQDRWRISIGAGGRAAPGIPALVHHHGSGPPRAAAREVPAARRLDPPATSSRARPDGPNGVAGRTAPTTRSRAGPRSARSRTRIRSCGACGLRARLTTRTPPSWCGSSWTTDSRASAFHGSAGAPRGLGGAPPLWRRDADDGARPPAREDDQVGLLAPLSTRPRRSAPCCATPIASCGRASIR